MQKCDVTLCMCVRACVCVRARAGSLNFVAYVPLPDQKEIEARVLEKKKADLLAMYTSESLRDKQQQAKELLNIRS